MMKNTSVIVDPSGKVPEKDPRLDLMVLELEAAGIVFCRLPYSFWVFWVFIEKRGGAGGGRGGHNPPGRLGP